MIRVIIADDIKEYRDHFQMLLNNEEDIEVIALAKDGNEVVEKSLKFSPDVVLMDIQMDSDDSGIMAMKEILKTKPDIKIIMLTIHGDKDNILKAFENGAYDFIEKTASSGELISSIHSAVTGREGESGVKKVNRVMVEEFVKLRKERESILFMITMLSRLSNTELEVLQSVMKGKKYREIAQERFIEEATVRTIASRICSKVGIKPLKEVVKIIEQNGIMDLFTGMNK